MKTYVSSAEVSTIYGNSRDAEFKTETVPFPALRNFSLLLKKLSQQLGESAEDEFWLPLLRELRGFWYEICAAPLSDHYLKDRMRRAQEALTTGQYICEQAYPDWAPYLRELSGQVRLLSEVKLDLLLEKVKDVARGERLQKLALAITRSRLIPFVEDAIRPLSRSIECEVITPEMLRAGVCYDSLILVGPPYWFPPFVFSAPRAGRIFIVRYKWLRGSPAPEAAFAAPLKHTGGRLPNFDSGETDDEADMWDSLLPASSAAYLARVAANQPTAPDDDVVEACAFVLEDGEIVFLEAEGASALVIDTKEKAANRVKRLETSQIEPGMFLLLRTEGGGDYILPVANRILGSYADSARKRQKRWKQLLRDMVRRSGLHAAIVELGRYGCTVAREINVRHWMSERSIKTKRRTDFEAIMQLVGLKDEVDDYWDTMTAIDRAHKKAGFYIREMLLDLVNKSDLTELDRRGMLLFELPDKDAGSLTAFRVNSVSPQTYMVAASRIGELMPEV